MNPRCAPERVGQAHLPNELADLRCCLRPAARRPRLPAPIGPEAAAVPADDGLWSDDCQGVQVRWDQAVQPDEDQPIDARQKHSLRRSAPEDIDLLTENQDLRLKSHSRLEQRREKAAQEHQNSDHRVEASTESLPLARPNEVCGRDTPDGAVYVGLSGLGSSLPCG
jgi:hypothetical protein